MKNILTAICIGAVGFMTPTIQANALENNALEQQATIFTPSKITVNGDYILLGDIFKGITENAFVPVALSPSAGKSLTLDAYSLYKIAKQNKIDWKPASSIIKVTVTKDGQEITPSRVMDLVTSKLKEENNLSDNIEISSQIGSFLYHAPVTVSEPIKLTELKLDERTGNFYSNVQINRGTQGFVNLRVTGRVHEKIEIAVPVKTIKAGEIIKESDLELVEVRSDKVRNGGIEDLSLVIGKQAKRSLYSGKPISQRDLTEPVLVEKGKLISVILKTDFMIITTRGQAQEDGSLNQIISIKNLKSGKIIKAMVTDKGFAEIKNGTDIAMIM